MRIIILTAVVLASFGSTLYQVKTGIDEGRPNCGGDYMQT
ncbi:MAG: hypothetical protein CM15mP46_6660 [Alphaproteobacteria bacterium]|nr:MAG: hypothetical protein CM15mP46_6660 [Alphaproteobacteria bacterium]